MREISWLVEELLAYQEAISSITVRLTFLAHSVRMRPNFQGLPWFQRDGLGNELLMRFLLN
jgi:hypothetical protein